MSYSGSKEYDRIPLAKCYECVVNRIPFLSSSRTLRGEKVNGQYVVYSYGVPIALYNANAEYTQWMIVDHPYSVTTTKHINAIDAAVSNVLVRGIIGHCVPSVMASYIQHPNLFGDEQRFFNLLNEMD